MAGSFDCISKVVGDLVFFSWAKGWELPQTAGAALPHQPGLLFAALSYCWVPLNIRTFAAFPPKSPKPATSLPMPVVA